MARGGGRRWKDSRHVAKGTKPGDPFHVKAEPVGPIAGDLRYNSKVVYVLSMYVSSNYDIFVSFPSGSFQRRPLNYLTQQYSYYYC